MIHSNLLPFLLTPGSSESYPRVYYKDFESFLNRGEEGGLGAVEGVCNPGFRGELGSPTGTFGCDKAAADPESTYAYPLGSAAGAEGLVVNGGRFSPLNAVPFTLRPGLIYFAGQSGSDGGHVAHAAANAFQLPASSHALRADVGSGGLVDKNCIKRPQNAGSDPGVSPEIATDSVQTRKKVQ